MIRNYEMPSDRLPLCPDRRPFERLPEDVIESLARLSISIPERRGRYTDAIREIIGGREAVPSAYVIIESHIDLTHIDDDLAIALAGIGFEPDDFALMEPAQYIRHFTQQFVCATSERVMQLYDLLRESSRAAIRLIEEHPIASGYLETEIYRSKYSSRYMQTELSNTALAHFPGDALRFEPRAVPRSAAEAEIRGIPLHSRRAADIHIKVPGGFPPQSWHSTADLIRQRQASRAPAEERLARRLAEAGFYEIVSQAGNFLFSAHFANMSEANLAFRALDGFARQSGGITGLVRESCSMLWRKVMVSDGETVLAEVPPLLSASWNTLNVRNLAGAGE